MFVRRQTPLIAKISSEFSKWNQKRSEKFGVCATEFGLVSYNFKTGIAEIRRKVAYKDPDFDEGPNSREYIVCDEEHHVALMSSKVLYSELPSFKKALDNEYLEDGEDEFDNSFIGTVEQRLKDFEHRYGGGFDDTIDYYDLIKDDLGGVDKGVVLGIVNPRKYPHFTECIPCIPT